MRRCCEDFDEILSEVLHELEQVLMRRSCEDSADILEESLDDQVLMRGSCGDPGEVLSKRSWHDLVQVLVRRSR